MPMNPDAALDIIPAPFIPDESYWRRPAALDRLAKGQSKAVVSRWRAVNSGVQEVTAESGDCHHTIGIALRHMDIAFFVAGRPIHDGGVLPGMLQASGPGEKLRAISAAPMTSSISISPEAWWQNASSRPKDMRIRARSA
jgi:hypothetical protein